METAAPAHTAKKPRSGHWLAASLGGLLALLLIAAGVAGLWARWGTTHHGWITSGSHRYSANGRAIVSGSVDADGIPDWLLAKVRVAASSTAGRPLFVGVARRTDVDRYLASVARSTVEDVNFGPFIPTYAATRGTAVPARPAAQTFWAQSQVGTGTQTVTWKLGNGKWRVVVMNADASPHVVADAKVGASIRDVLALPIALVAIGLGLALAGATVALIRKRPRVA